MPTYERDRETDRWHIREEEVPAELTGVCPRVSSGRNQDQGDGRPCQRFSSWVCNSTNPSESSYCGGRVAAPEDRPVGAPGSTRTAEAGSGLGYGTLGGWSTFSVTSERTETIPSPTGEVFGEEKINPSSFDEQCYCQRCGNRDVKILKMNSISNWEDHIVISCPRCHRDHRRSDPGITEFIYQRGEKPKKSFSRLGAEFIL